ncbi:hypothetical protein COC42_03490 [Sphingomonas spermidinifaciens]|uniref:Uncharacterized protein n=1 Tax=Sphingomonas spermidinifaciens TaxID=1141889 RepID=A0A2A4B6R5_9SPHN|nr:hypothetical protein COC42_03490 [Sphingomonas spermidinifaciens]
MLILFSLTSAPLAAQEVGPALDPTVMTGWTAGEAVQHDLERRARSPRARQAESRYERWRNRPGKRDCGAYNWKCPAKARRAR